MKYPIEPLAQALGIPPPLNKPAIIAIAHTLGISERAMKQARTRGGWEHATAGNHAITAGHHPSTIWPRWDQDLPDRLTDADWYPDDPPLDQLDPYPGALTA